MQAQIIQELMEAELIKDLIDSGVDPNIQDENGDTPLIRACKIKNIKLVNYILEKGVNLNIQNNEGYTALLIACKKGYVETIKLLLEKGANVNLRNLENKNAYYYAYVNREYDICKLLIEYGSDIYNIHSEKNNMIYYTQDKTQEIFKSYYSVILNYCFLNYNFEQTKYVIVAVKFFIWFIFKFNFELFKIFAIEYMFLHNSYNIISEFYENKTLQLYTNSNNKIVLRIFGMYDAPLDFDNLTAVSAIIKKDKIIYRFIIYKLYTIDEDSVLLENLHTKDLYTNQNAYFKRLLNSYVFQTENKIIELTPQEHIDIWKSCSNEFILNNQELNVEILKYYTYIGDRCIHNILRNQSNLNNTTYCKYSNEIITNYISTLNNFIWKANEEKFMCDPEIAKIDHIVLYRGTELKNMPMTKDSIINSHKNQFISFSSNLDVAMEFGNIILQLFVDKWSVVLPLEDISIASESISKFPREGEWICPTGTSFRVIDNAYIHSVGYSNYIIIPIEIKSQDKLGVKIYDVDELQNFYNGHTEMNHQIETESKIIL